MVNRIFAKGRDFLVSQQNSVISAAFLIMLMIISSRILGLVRQRVLTHFFEAEELGIFFAAFRLPDLIFEVLVFGTFSSAFIPVFTRLSKNKEDDAWKLASHIVTLGGLFFIIAALLVGLSSDFLYSIFAPGFTTAERSQVVELTRILFFAQGFFVISYVLTGAIIPNCLAKTMVPKIIPKL